MAFQTWSNSTPAGTALANTLDTVITGHMTAVQERLSQEHLFKDASSAADSGKHLFSGIRVSAVSLGTVNMGAGTAATGTFAHTITNTAGTATAPDLVFFTFAAGTALDGTALTGAELQPVMTADCFVQVQDMTTTVVTYATGPGGLGIVTIAGVKYIIATSTVTARCYTRLTAGVTTA